MSKAWWLAPVCGLILTGVLACGTEGPASDPDAGTAVRADADPSSDASSALDAALEPDATAPPDAGSSGELDASSNALERIEITLLPGPTLLPSETGTAAASGVLANGQRIDLSRAATWHTSSSTTVRVLAGGRVIADGVGRSTIWASRGGIESNKIRVEVAEETPVDDGELRGVWVTRWTFSSVADIQRIVDDVAGANMNAIFFQVRGSADAYYQSTHEPWAKRLTGTLGRDPGWDPLQEMITRANARGIEVHAWLNTFPAWTGLDPPEASAIPHPLSVHPEWLCADESGTAMAPRSSDYQFFSPGNPDVRAHIANVALEIATRYAVAGIHFDYVRYPGRVYCHDAVSEAEFARARLAAPALTYDDFQRSNVTALLTDVRQRLLQARPQVVITTASWGIYRNNWGWTSVSRGYDDYYQDAHTWARTGIVDALCPMTYWRITEPKGQRTDWATLVEDHIAAATAGNRYVYAAVHGDHDADELLRQVALARASGARGLMFFELGYLRTRGHLARLAAGPFAQPASIPRYPWR